MNVDPFRYTNATASIPAIWHYLSGIFSFVCLTCGLCSNGLVICVFVRYASLRRSRHFLLINLAVTDLGLLLTNSSLHIIASFHKRWPFGGIGCTLYALCGGICGLTSIATMAAISLTRLAVVIRPFSSLKLNRNFTLKCIVGSWIYGAIWIIPPLFGWSRYMFEGFGTTCTFDYISKDPWDRLFLLVLVVGGFLVPLSIIIVSYIFILMKLSQRGQHLKSSNSHAQIHPPSSTERSTHDSCPMKLLNTQESIGDAAVVLTTDIQYILRRINDTEARATRTALLVCAIFCLAWGPYTMVVICWQFGYDSWINAYTTAMLGLFAKTAACINPLIYVLSSAAFRAKIGFQLKLINQGSSVSNEHSNKNNVIKHLDQKQPLSKSLPCLHGQKSLLLYD